MLKLYEKVKSEDLSRKEIRKLKKELKEGVKEDSGSQKDAVEDDGSKDMSALVNHADKLIDLVWKLRDNISDEAKEKLRDLVEEISKVVGS